MISPDTVQPLLAPKHESSKRSNASWKAEKPRTDLYEI